MKKIFKRSVWALLTVFFTFLFVIVLVLGQIAAQYAPWIDTFFNASRVDRVETGDGEEDAEYFKTKYPLTEEAKVDMRAETKDVTERVNEEGSVLLWNKGGALPLSSGAKVSVFGHAVLKWIYTGIGSGSVSDIAVEPDIETSLTSRGFVVNPEMATAYRFFERLGKGGPSTGGSTSEASWSDISGRSGLVDKIAEYGDAAIYVSSRWGGEGGDQNLSASNSADGVGLSFSNEEVSVLKGLCDMKAEGRLKKVILVIDSANVLSLRNIKDLDIDACLWVGWGGDTATDALADLLVGNANPSGKFTDTWAWDIRSAPAMENFGNFSMGNSEGIPADYNKYVVYQEGIYVGYRYYETRYEDLVMKRGNADGAAGVRMGEAKWNYADEVAYTFGHGESYTTFSYGKLSVRKDGTDYKLSVSVTNTGSVAGKEVVEIYLQKPYTQYDIENKVEKSAVDLVGFAKTGLLEPGKSETVEITVPEYEFKSYDSNGKKTYILEAGDYYLAAGRDAHDALNNILAAKGYTESDGMDAAGDASFVHKQTYAKDDFEKYSVSPTGYSVTNQFDNADINRYKGTEDQKITYLSRNDWNGTYPSSVTLSCTNDTLLKDMQFDREVAEDPEAEMPLYGTVTSEFGALSLVQLRGLPYDSEVWEDLLNQMTWDEQIQYAVNRMCGAESINAPNGRIFDGPCGLSSGSNEVNEYGIGSHYAFPCSPITASTFNVELVEDMGECFAEEFRHNNLIGVYGFGANTHRTAFAGRNWEYYSEDGFLAGLMHSSEMKGFRTRGMVAITKHFALNDQETNRMVGITTWSNEQAIREIYLKAFEHSVTDGYSNAFMTSFNRIGATWTGLHSGLLTEVCRGEWGFEGFYLTDAGNTNKVMGSAENTSVFAAGLIAGNDCWYTNMDVHSLDDYRDNPTVMQAVRESAHRQLWVTINSAAMNGITSTTRIMSVTPAWEQALLAVEILSGIFTAASLAMLAVSWVFWYKDERKTKN